MKLLIDEKWYSQIKDENRIMIKPTDKNNEVILIYIQTSPFSELIIIPTPSDNNNVYGCCISCMSLGQIFSVYGLEKNRLSIFLDEELNNHVRFDYDNIYLSLRDDDMIISPSKFSDMKYIVIFDSDEYVK